jgi:hypothetical protein
MQAGTGVQMMGTSVNTHWHPDHRGGNVALAGMAQ